MQKIPTLFQRSENRRYVTDVVTPGCEWVLAGEGTATRKYDGTCVALIDGEWWARREVKRGKPTPDEFRPVSFDEVTGKTIGWEPAAQSGFARYFDEAVRRTDSWNPWYPGTYELCGPKVNGNPERLPSHFLVRHDTAERIKDWPPSDVDAEGIRQLVRQCHGLGWEGIVWRHPDGRMAKVKARDYPPVGSGGT